MKKWIILVILFLVGPLHAQTVWKGKLDLGSNPSAIGLRELHDGNWLAGFEHPIWHLERNSIPMFNINFFTAWRALQGDPAYGPSFGMNIGQAGSAIGNIIGMTAPALYDKTPWIQQLGNFVSIEIYTGYRPVHSADTHAFMYGIGGKVTIPLDLLKGL